MTDSRRTETTSFWSDSGSTGAPIGLLAPGTDLAERYEIRSVLGHGGFAVVYLAHDRELGRDVALKILREDRLTPGSLSRLKREVRVARDLAHANLVRVFDIESAGSAVFLTMEAVRGGSLRDQLKGGPLPVEVAIGLATQLFRALAALHGVGIVHRDIKPGNVLLTEEGGVKLADFGLALHLEGGDTRVTATETAVGTLEYLSPEQAMGETLDARSDLYSAGVVLFEMLTGRLPHEGRSSLGNLIARFRERPPDLAALRPGVPRWLARVVERLLAREPRDRYLSAVAVLHDLERRRAAARPSRRRRFATVASILAALAVAVVASLFAEMRGHRFATLVREGAEGLVALDRAGRPLWRRDHVRSNRSIVPFRLGSGKPLAIAAIQPKASSVDLDEALRLDFLDPQTGGTLETLRLPDSSGDFSGFARTYTYAIDALDLDGDGADELIVNYAHQPWWPFFAVLVEPALRQARAIFVASGHHFLEGMADLDADGRPELLFAGVNNRLGWRTGFAAVKIDPWIGTRLPARTFLPLAVSGDRPLASVAQETSLWYALGPRRFLRTAEPRFIYRPERRSIEILFRDGSAETLGLDGLPTHATPAIAEPERAAAHRRAWRTVPEVLRLLDGGRGAEALPWVGRGLAEAETAGASHLAVWLRHARLRALADAGRNAEIDRDLEAALALEPEAASELAFELARTWHRHGELERALAAYRRARALPGYTASRGPFEVLEGIVLTLVEIGRPEEALAEASSSSSVVGEAGLLARPYVEFVRWRLGERPAPGVFPGRPDDPELFRYWKLEMELASGASEPATLLARVGGTAPLPEPVAPLVASLRSELLYRVGRRTEAIEVARTALRDLDRGLPNELAWRVHRPILAERLARFESGRESLR